MRSLRRLSLGFAAVAMLLAACTTAGTTEGSTEDSTSESIDTSGPTAEPSPAAAEARSQPTYGDAVVDGDPGEWDLANDFFANMYQAGKPDKDVLSKVYVRYSCEVEGLFVLVLTEPGWEILPSDDDNFVKLGNSNKLVDGASGNDGVPPDFEYVPDLTGWEASATLSPGSYSDLNVHAQVEDVATRGDGETSAVADRAIPIELVCDGTSTTTSTSTTSTTVAPSTTSSVTDSTSTTSTTVAPTTTLAPTTTTTPSPTSTTTVEPTTTVDPSDSTTTTGEVGGSSVVSTTVDVGSETLPNTGPESPFGTLSIAIWLALLALSLGALLVRVVRSPV